MKRQPSRNLLIALVLMGLPVAAPSLADEAAKLKGAARAEFHRGDSEKAREHLAALLGRYRAEHAGDSSWRGQYQWSRRLTEVAHEHLRAGQFDEALAIMGEAADLDVPLRNGFDNGWASAAGGLHRRLAALDSDERFELLNRWSMPTESRPTVRMLESFVPMTAPPSAFARVFGERPRDSSFPIARVGDVSGLFSTAWELIAAADEAGRLRQLTAELEALAERKVANARHVLMLAKIAGARSLDERLKSDLTQSLVMLRDSTSRPTDNADTAGFGDAWQYGYGKFDLTSERIVGFSRYAVWSGAAWQMIANRPHDTLSFVRVDRTGGHPTDPFACIRRWVAPADGVLSLTGTMHHPAEPGDGVRGRVVSSRMGLRGEWLAHDGTTETRLDAIEVKAGDTIDFAVDAIDSTHYDTFVWMFQLRLETSAGSRTYDSAADFLGPSEARLLSDAVLAAACLERAWLQPLGARIFEKLLENTYDSDSWLNRPHESDSRLIRPVLRRAWAASLRKRFGDRESNLLDDAELGSWVPSSGLISSQHAQGQARQSWLASEGQLVHLAGPGNDLLFFKYPLTGEFTFSVEAQSGGRPGTDGGVSYGGLTYHIDNAGQHFTVSDLEARQAIVRACPDVRTGSRLTGQYAGQPGFNHLALASTAGRVTFACNGQTISSDPANEHASPWVALRSVGDRTPIFRHVKLTGKPIIPREIPMSQGDSLSGWTCGYYGEWMPWLLPDQHSGAEPQSQDHEPPKRVDANFLIPEILATQRLALDQRAESRPGGSAIGPDGSTVENDWFAMDGIIHATRRERESAAVAQSRLYYFRPLLDREAISYEFQYAPGRFEVHPALGRLAFLIEPGGVRLPWMTDGDREWTGLGEDNSVVEPFDRRGPKLDRQLADLPLVLDHEFSAGFKNVFHGANWGAVKEDQQVRIAEAGLRVEIPGELGDGQHWLTSRFRFGGDFDISVSFEQLSIETVAAEPRSHAGIGAYAFMDQRTNDHLYFLRKRHPPGFQQLEMGHSFLEGKSSRHVGAPGLAHDGHAGTIRFARRGKTAYCLFADGDSTQFRITAQYEVPTSDSAINAIRLNVNAGGGATTKVVWKKISVRAGAFDPLDAKPNLPRSR